MTQHSVRVSPQFKALRWRLLLSSLGVIGGTLTAFGMVVYHVVSRSLEQKSDQELSILADAAAHSLSDVLAQHTTTAAPLRTLDNDGDLDIPWQDLQRAQQAVEWFDSNGQLVGRSGNPLITNVLQTFSPKDDVSQEPGQEDGIAWDTTDVNRDEMKYGRVHWLTVPVYSDAPKPVLQGYVRVSASNEAIAAELGRLRQGLQWGGLLALGLSGLGGWWLVRQSLRPIERSMQQLQQFTADASHELRNPLTAIKTSVEVMQSHPERLDKADISKLAAIASATNQMSRLVEDLLWLARFDRLSPHQATLLSLPIDEVLEELVDQYLPQAEQKAIAFTTDLQADATVKGDPYQLKRLVANLLANALYYTPAGGRITLTSWVEDDWILIRVEDTGIGIAPEQLPFVFHRFWRSEQARVHREGGSGLGLAIAWAIAQGHGGDISVRSEVGKGSCFQITLPAH